MILVIYSTVDGHTRTICQRLCGWIEAEGQATRLVDLAEAAALDLAGFDKLVIGASIRYGHHRPELATFIEARRALLQARPVAFFSVNIVARKPDKNRPETNPYLKKFLARLRWQPQLAGVFAGRLDYPRLGALDRTMIRLIMWITHGPTDPTAVVEFTDWAQVQGFAGEVARL
jgi:menaquinone-dependent protoporphyrinogen oxidase